MMAALLLVFSLVLFYHQNSGKGGLGENAERITALTSFPGVADLPSVPETLPKIALLFSLVPVIWALMLRLALQDVHRHLIRPVNFFLRKINFVFVSTQAP